MGREFVLFLGVLWIRTFLDIRLVLVLSFSLFLRCDSQGVKSPGNVSHTFI